MSIDRLSQLEVQYDLLQEQLHAKELEKITVSLGDQTRIQQQINLGILPQLKECKQKYLDALASGTTLDSLSEKQATVIVGEIVEELTIAKPDAATPETVDLIEQILAKLKEPESPVLRLKLGVKLPFEIFEAGAELEGDAVALWKEHCPTFESWRQKAKKLLPPA
jgi:hypothetical protein